MSRDREPAGPSLEDEPGAAVAVAEPPALRARCWGTRGSVPTPGPETVRFGGNTSCVEVLDRSGGRLIFDAGSGIRPLGEAIARSEQPAQIDLFLTHFHWDHIQGLPFFRPLYSEQSSVRIHGAGQGGAGVQELLAGQMGQYYFPVPFDALTAQLEFHDLAAQPFERGSGVVTAHRLRHPTNAYGFRVDTRGGSVAYLPDNELAGGQYDVPAGWYESLCRFVADVDVLFHDAMFTDEEYPHYEGWGHSSVSQAIRLAEDAGVRRLCLFHHSPDRTDSALERLLEDAREELARRGSALQLDAAAEGEELVVEERS
jgi:phosphoribosyl 1,2-cyclic phosphodiesterase